MCIGTKYHFNTNNGCCRPAITKIWKLKFMISTFNYCPNTLLSPKFTKNLRWYCTINYYPNTLLSSTLEYILPSSKSLYEKTKCILVGCHQFISNYFGSIVRSLLEVILHHMKFAAPWQPATILYMEPFSTWVFIMFHASTHMLIL
jgi:hypothetical protein